MVGYQTPPRREPMPEYTTWTMSQLKSARRALQAVERYLRQKHEGVPLPDPPVTGPGVIWTVTDLDGVTHTIYMDEPTPYQKNQANFTPLPTVHETPDVCHSHDMTTWKGFRQLHHKCMRCGGTTSAILKAPCQGL